MKDLTQRKDLIAVALVLLIVLLLQGAMHSGKMTGAVAGIPLERGSCFEEEYKTCGGLCFEKSQDADLAGKLPSDWLESCLNNCEKKVAKKCP